jgi:UDP-3-O-[3-hydroxymyristoyl] glucosamine N-acyltransferase
MKTEIYFKDLVTKLSQRQPALIEQIVDEPGITDSLKVTGARSLQLATETEIVFCKSDAPDNIALVLETKSQCVITSRSIFEKLPKYFTENRVFVLTQMPRRLLAEILQPFVISSPLSNIDGKSIHPNAKIDTSVQLGAGVAIGANVEIGPGCVIGSNTVIDHAVIDQETYIGANCSIGGDGFGYEIDEDSMEVIKIPHFGLVRIGKGVEIFSNVCIARGSLADTIIEDSVRIDNLVHVAHNCVIGRNSFIIANTMLGGSSVIGEGVWVAPSTSILNGIALGNGSMTGLGAVVTKAVGENDLVAGVPARRLRSRRE